MNSKLYLVVGLGKTGRSIAHYLKRRGINFVLFDTRETLKDLQEFKNEFSGVDIYLGNIPEYILKKITTVIASPGVDCNIPLIKAFKANSIPVYGDIECFAKEVKSPVIAITGTNGKSTVTSLVGEMARSFGINVGVGGNIGTPVLDMLDDGQEYALWVLELSSFQLDLTYTLKPIAATILNVSPDHLDRHGSLENYVLAKQRVYTDAEYYIFNRDDEYSKPYSIDIIDRERLVSYGLDEPVNESDWGIREVNEEIYLAHGHINILPITNARLKGRHNWLNMLSASALAYVAGISYTAIKNALENFQSLPHRSELIRTLDGVDWIDDSKGTNIGATIAALDGLGGAIKGKIVLIAGGQGKGADFRELRSSVAKFVKEIIVIGQDAELIKSALEDVTVVKKAEQLKDAVMMAKNVANNGDMVLLSPACASLDMFRDFNHRGEVFAEEVSNLC